MPITDRHFLWVTFRKTQDVLKVDLLFELIV
jgi:hypothetical protein